MDNWITNTIQALGYIGIGLMMFLENLFPPIPSELIMPLAGFTVAQGHMGFVPVVLAGVIGTVLGALPWYYAGVYISEHRLKRWADRYGKWLTLSSSDIDKANRWFKRRGDMAVLLCRLVPGLRTVISLPAGMSQMPFERFLLYSTIGTTLWVTLLTTVGYLLGNNYHLVDVYLGPVSKVVVVGLGLVLGGWVWQRRRRLAHSKRAHRKPKSFLD